MEARRPSAHSRWRVFSKLWLGVLVGGLAFVTLVCGWTGFSRQYQAVLQAQTAAQAKGAEPSPPIVDPTIPIYKTFQLFLLNSGAEDDPDHPSNWLLAVARFSSISLLVVLSVATILTVVDQVLSFPRQITQKNHLVICGLGEVGLQILVDARRLKPPRPVVVIELNPESPWLDYARQRGAFVLVGDATRGETLLAARTEYAAEVFVVTGDDGVNLEIAAELGELLRAAHPGSNSPARQRTNPLRMYVHIVDVIFSSSLQPSGHVLHNPDSMQVRVFNVPRTAATRLITEQIVQHAPQHSEEIAHYVLIGFGPMGQMLAVQLAQLAHFQDRQRCRITIADRDVRTTARGFLDRFPRFTSWTAETVGVAAFPREADAWTFNAHPLPEGIRIPHPEAVQYACNAEFVDLPQATAGELLARHLARVFADPHVSVKPVVFICGEQDQENFETAVRLRRLLENECATAAAGQAVPISVWLPRQPALSRHLREATGFTPFGESQATASYHEVTEPFREILGRAIHAEHQRGKQDPVGWETIHDDYRESSRAAADHALIKLATLQGQPAQPEIAETAATPFPIGADTPEELLLAQMEHNRWLGERLLSDWRYARIGPDPAQIDAGKTQRLNETIIPWEHLSQPERDKDHHQVRIVLRACQSTPSLNYTTNA